MKFLSNPDKFVFAIGVGIVGFLFIFFYMILNRLGILTLLLVLWVLFSAYWARSSYIEYLIQDDKFIIRHMGRKIEVHFNDINYIIEFSSCTNPIKEKRYEIRLNNNLGVSDKLFKIENRSFTRWIGNQKDRFIIEKHVFHGQ